MIDTIDMFNTIDSHTLLPAPNSTKKRGRPRSSSLSRTEQVRLANKNARHQQRELKGELIELLISLFVNPKINIFEKDRVPKVNVPASKLGKAICLAAGIDADESSYDIVNIIKNMKSAGGRNKQDLVTAIRDAPHQN